MTPIIIGGDFNVIPNDEDVYSPENYKNDACAHPLTREQFRILLNSGFTDTVKFFVDGNTMKVHERTGNVDRVIR